MVRRASGLHRGSSPGIAPGEKLPNERQESGSLAVIAWSAAAIALIAVVAVAKLAADIVAPTVLAGLFALTLSPVVRSLERRRVPSSRAAAAVAGAGISVVVLAGYSLLPSAEDWRAKVPTIARTLERQFRNIGSWVP